MTPPRSPVGGPARDTEAARKFAVKWSTKSSGEIANLSGCYLRAMGDLGTLQRIARDVVAHWDEIHCTTPDPEGLWRGIEELRELTKEPARSCL